MKSPTFWWGIVSVIAMFALIYGVSRPRHDNDEPVLIRPPELTQQPIRLRVVHAVNPRLPKLGGAQVASVLAATRVEARRYFGVDVDFDPAVEIPISALFEHISPKLARRASESEYTRRLDHASLLDRRSDFEAMLAGQQNRLTQYRAYVARALPAEGEPIPLAQRLAQVQHDGLLRWLAVLADDGKPVIDGNPYNEYMHWSALGYAGLPYDLVLTNQLVASDEHGAVAVHSAVRGGVTLGGTEYNRGSALGTFSFVTTFPMLSEHAWTLSLREGEPYASEEVVHYVQLVLLHELGHQLFHYADVFDVQTCVMGPTPALRFREWAATVSATGCPMSHPQMQRGAARMSHWPSLQE